jgi:AraC-like DNA-binding protein
MNGPPLQRVAGLAGAPDLMRELGFDPRHACAGLSFTPDDLAPDLMIPFADAVQFLANCERVTGLEHFGLMLGARQDHLSLGPIGQLMHAAPTLGDAIRDYIRVQVGLSRGATVYSYRLDGGVTLGFGIYHRHSPGAKQAYGFAMAVGANLVRALTGGKANPLEIHFCHRPPADPGLYGRILKAKALFDQYQSCAILSRSDLKLANPHADPARYANLSGQLAALVQKAAVSPAALLRHRMKPLLMQGEYTLEAISKRLGLHPRQLNRRLLDDGTSFIAIRDQARFRSAQELLALTDLPVGEIGTALSFSTHGNFARAFRRWGGVTPSEWRSSALEIAGLEKTGADISALKRTGAR